ncbi:hypothetical protein, partial [Yersinia mollaretii]|uniref:hypothetical protein n=1 Tax=Yersinia mollaretii TaxID=33060 RepID=UPI0025AB19C9
MNNKNSYDQHTVNDNDVNVNDPLLKKHQGVNGDMLLDKLDDNGKVIWRERGVHNQNGELVSTVITTFGRTETGRIINRHDATYNTSGELIKCNELISYRALSRKYRFVFRKYSPLSAVSKL